MSFWTRTQAPATEGHATQAVQAHDVKSAYDKGRRDERASRKRHPFMMGGLIVLAAAGASLITLAAIKGSFGEAGAVADQNIAAAAERAAPVVHDAVTGVTDAARDAGDKVGDKGRELTSRDNKS
jgi:hypothetical protein